MTWFYVTSQRTTRKRGLIYAQEPLVYAANASRNSAEITVEMVAADGFEPPTKGL